MELLEIMLTSQPLSINNIFSLLDGITRSSVLIILLFFNKVPNWPTTDPDPPRQLLLKRLARQDRGTLPLSSSPSWPRRTTGEWDRERFWDLERLLWRRPQCERWQWWDALSSEYDSDDGDLFRLLWPPSTTRAIIIVVTPLIIYLSIRGLRGRSNPWTLGLWVNRMLPLKSGQENFLLF